MSFCKVVIANIMYIVETFIKGTCWGGEGGAVGGGSGFKLFGLLVLSFLYGYTRNSKKLGMLHFQLQS